MPASLEVRVGGRDEALDRFEAAWHLASGRTPPKPVAVLSFADLPLLLKSLTPARWALLQALRHGGPSSVLGLAKRLGRDYKNVHTDVKQLAELGLVERRDDGRVAVPWQVVRADLRL